MQQTDGRGDERTGATTDGRPEITQELESPDFAEQYTFSCRCFDIERDAFPYPDNTFDLVTWCEVIEHLTLNPVWALSEIHRVLKPGGAALFGGMYRNMPEKMRVSSEQLRESARRSGIETIRVIDDNGQWLEIRKKP